MARYLGSEFNYLQQDITDLNRKLFNAISKTPAYNDVNVITPENTGTNPLVITTTGGTTTVSITNSGQVYINPTGVLPPLVLGSNATDQKVIGLNADKLDGFNEDYFLTSLPTSALRNVIYGPDTVTPLLGLLVYPGTLVNPFLIVDAGLNTLMAVNQYGQVVVSPTTAMPPMVLGGNSTGRLVTGFNADLLDGYHASQFALSGAAGITDHGALSGLSDDDHTQYVHSQPSTFERNIIQPVDDVTPLRIKPWTGGHSENLFECLTTGDIAYAYINGNYKVFGLGLDAGNEKITSLSSPTTSNDAVNLGYLTGNYKSYTGSTATGTILVGNGTTFTGLPIGTNDQVLAVTGSTVAWKTTNQDWSYWYGFERRPITAAVTGGAFTLAVADASLANTNDEDGFTMGRTAADSNITYLAFQFACPTELDTTQAMNATVYCRIAGAGAGQLEFICRARAVNRDEGMLAGGTYRESSGTQSLTSYASDDLATVAITNVFTAGELNSANSQFIKGSIVRDATAGNANDTYANSVIVLGVRFSGSRKRYT